MDQQEVRYYPDDEMEIDLIDLFVVLWKGKWIIMLITALAMVGAVGYGLMEERVYEVSASFAVMRSSPIRVGMGEELRQDISVLLSILRSDQLARVVVEELDLESLWERENTSAAVRSLRNGIKIDTNREQSVITVSYQSTSPQEAKDIVDSYIQNFVRINQEVNLTETVQAVAFVEERLEEVERELADAVAELQAFQDKYRIFSLTEQSKALVDSYVKLEDRLREARQDYNVRLETLSPQNPELRVKKRNIEEMERQLLILEKGLIEEIDEELIQISGTLIGLQDIPRLTLELSRLNQEIEILRETYQLLRSQLEVLKIDASRESEILRLIDPPLLPQTPEGRGIALKGAIAGVLGAMISVFLLFVIDFLKKSDLSPEVLEEVPFLKRFVKSSEKKKGKIDVKA